MQHSAFHRLVLAGVLAACAPGCGGGSSGEAYSSEQIPIVEIAQIYRGYKKGQKPPPKGLKDFLPYERGFPAAIKALNQKEVFVFWGAGLADGPDASSTILAYHKDTPEKGGEVLMQDGTAKKISADEFKAAKKPEGASTDPGSVPGAKKK